jgi:hypothetical protein
LARGAVPPPIIWIKMIIYPIRLVYLDMAYSCPPAPDRNAGDSPLLEGEVKLEPIFPNQVKMTVKNEPNNTTKASIYEKKAFLWMLKLCRLILVLTRFLKKLNFRWAEN